MGGLRRLLEPLVVIFAVAGFALVLLGVVYWDCEGSDVLLWVGSLVFIMFLPSLERIGDDRGGEGC